MSWTDERVEVLKKLWMEGLSASQIAGELGQGVTRNAVIGKVHRLKLSGRAKPATSSPRARPAHRTPRRPSTNSASSGGGTMKRRTMSPAMTIGATALKSSEAPNAEMFIAPNMAEELVIPMSERVSLLDLSEQNCKWPIGDPLNTDFHFCGRNSLEGKPYCEFHSRRAYHTVDRKRR